MSPTVGHAPGYRSVILDVDSTLSGIEGIDWLAMRRGSEIALEVSRLTDRAMAGEIELRDVYGLRLDMVQPTRSDIEELSAAYLKFLASDAMEVIGVLQDEGIAMQLVSGGIRNAILPLASALGINHSSVHAVDVHLKANGEYAGFERDSPLTTNSGKAVVAGALALPPRIIAVGDGMTDAAMKPRVDTFAVFTGFVCRDAVVALSDIVVQTFDQLREVVLHG